MKIRENHWTPELIEEWLPLWSELWAVGVEWEWQAGDLWYVAEGRRTGRLTNYQLFSLWSANNPIPLPSLNTLSTIALVIHSSHRDLFLRLNGFMLRFKG